MTQTADLILKIQDISKIFPGVKALDHVQLDLRRGEIHALIGENGAGKSTFIKALTGVHQPDSGSIQVDGETVVMTTPLVARRHGIAAIYQHLAAYPHLSVAENIFMANEQTRGQIPLISWFKTRAGGPSCCAPGQRQMTPPEMGTCRWPSSRLWKSPRALSERPGADHG